MYCLKVYWFFFSLSLLTLILRKVYTTSFFGIKKTYFERCRESQKDLPLSHQTKTVFKKKILSVFKQGIKHTVFNSDPYQRTSQFILTA